MPPVIGTGVGRIDAERSTASIACSTRSTFGQPEWRSRISPPGRTIRHRREGLAAAHGAQNVDARDDGAEVVRRPADVGEDAARREAQDAPAAIEDLLGDVAAEADPVLDPLLEPDQLDVGERVGCAARS